MMHRVVADLVTVGDGALQITAATIGNYPEVLDNAHAEEGELGPWQQAGKREGL